MEAESKTSLHYKINRSKLSNPKKFGEQILLALDRHGEKTGEIPVDIDVIIGHDGCDIIHDKLTIEISFNRLGTFNAPQLSFSEAKRLI